jgi:hypothetical protein
MKSKSASEGELANLPEPTWEDIEALAHASGVNTMNAEEYFAFVMALTKGLPAPRVNTDADEPFTLP